MANLQASQLGIHGEDSWWQLFDLIIIQVPAKKVYPESNDYYELVYPIFPDLFSVNKKNHHHRRFNMEQWPRQ